MTFLPASDAHELRHDTDVVGEHHPVLWRLGRTVVNEVDHVDAQLLHARMPVCGVPRLFAVHSARRLREWRNPSSAI